MGTGWPSRVAGRKCICLTVETTASSRPKPAQRTTSTRPTSPSAPISAVTSTVASAPARAAGEPYRLVARARLKPDGSVSASVRPERVGPPSPFVLAAGTSLVVHFELDVLPGLTLVAHHPDLQSTAYGLLADFLNIARDEIKPLRRP